MARSNEMVDRIDNRDLSPASQPADLSQSGVTPDSYYSDQAEDRAAATPDDGAPRAGSVETAQDLPPPNGEPEPQTPNTGEQSGSVDGQISQQAGMQVGLGATTPDGQGGSTDYDVAIGARMDTDTAAGVASQSSMSGSSVNPDLLRDETSDGSGPGEPGQLADALNDAGALSGPTGALGGAASSVTGTVGHTVDAVQGSVGQVAGVVGDGVTGLGTIVQTDVSEVIGSAAEGGEVIGDAAAGLGPVAGDQIGEVLGGPPAGGLLGGLFDPGSDDSSLDSMLTGGSSDTGLSGGLLDDGVAMGLLDAGADGGDGLLGVDDLDDGVGGLL